MKNTRAPRQPGSLPFAAAPGFRSVPPLASLLLLLAALLGACASERPSWPAEDWPTSLPLTEGMDPKALSDLDRDIAAGRYGCVDSLLVIRHGQVVWDRSYPRDYGQ